MRLNLRFNISDGFFIVVTDTIFGIMIQAMNFLPTLALFAKITPHKIEGTVFAFLTGTSNLASIILSLAQATARKPSGSVLTAW